MKINYTSNYLVDDRMVKKDSGLVPLPTLVAFALDHLSTYMNTCQVLEIYQVSVKTAVIYNFRLPDGTDLHQSVVIMQVK